MVEFKSCTQNDTTVNGDEVRQPPDEPDITPGPTGVDPSAPASHHTASYARTHADQGQPAFPASTTRRRRNASWLHEWCRSEKKQAFDRNGQPTTATWFTCPHCGAELQGTGNAGDHVGRPGTGVVSTSQRQAPALQVPRLWVRPPVRQRRLYQELGGACVACAQLLQAALHRITAVQEKRICSFILGRCLHSRREGNRRTGRNRAPRTCNRDNWSRPQ